MMDVHIKKADFGDQAILKNMYAFYLHDLSRYTNALDINDDGTYEFDAFGLIWEKEGMEPYFIIADGRLAGFFLLLRAPFLEKADYCVNDLFIYNAFRRKKAAESAIKLLFNGFKGTYYIEQLKQNDPAVRFWKKIYQDYQLNLKEITRTEDGEECLAQFFNVE